MKSDNNSLLTKSEAYITARTPLESSKQNLEERTWQSYRPTEPRRAYHRNRHHTHEVNELRSLPRTQSFSPSRYRHNSQPAAHAPPPNPRYQFSGTPSNSAELTQVYDMILWHGKTVERTRWGSVRTEVTLSNGGHLSGQLDKTLRAVAAVSGKNPYPKDWISEIKISMWSYEYPKYRKDFTVDYVLAPHPGE
jgi:hypothetical protein